jgi:hypothetical protein
MPTGIYKRKREHKIKISQGLKKIHQVKEFGFKKGKQSWNKGLKGLQPWMNISGLKGGWNKGIKMKEKFPRAGFQKGHPLFPNLPRGEKHYRWIKDRSILIRNKRNDPEYKQWVKKVKKIDKNTCCFKNKDCSGYNIVHHIYNWSEYPELRYKVENGITICQAHHPRTRAKEKSLIPFFMNLVMIRSK